MKRHILSIAVFLPAFLFGFAFFQGALAMQNADYCQVPSYVVQNVSPNILILLDNSGSMYNFAYTDTGNDCSGGSDKPCTGFDPTQTYYGYFDPDTWYQYSSNVFSPDTSTHAATIGSSITNPNTASDWNGNFLNWLTMRRMDVVKKALTGGLCPGANGACNTDSNGNTKLQVIQPDYYGRGDWKQVASYTNYVPTYNGQSQVMFQTCDPTSGNSCSGAKNGGNFTIFKTSQCNTYCAPGQTSQGQCGYYQGFSGYYCSGTVLGSYSIQVSAKNVHGVLQDQVSNRARVGLATYGAPWNEPNKYGSTGTGDGANIVYPITENSLSSVTQSINGEVPSANTPLAEALFESAGYFGQVGRVSPSFQNQFPGGPGPANYSGGNTSYYPSSSGNYDPYNYGTNGQPNFPSCSKNFILLITDGEPCEDGEIPSSIMSYAAGRSPFVCTNTGTLSGGGLSGSCPARCSDGSNPATDPGGVCPANTVLYPAETTFQSCGAGNASAGLESVALWLHDGAPSPIGIANAADDIRPDLTATYKGLPRTITLYTVFAFGQGSTLLKYASINGGFNDTNGDYKPDGGADAKDISEWSSSGTGQPDTYFEASQGGDLETELKNALSAMLKRASSGTAASVLASGEGSGANLVQAVFYPKRAFGSELIDWSGAMHDLWYYVDPYFTHSDILEDTNQDDYLTLTKDDIAQFYFDQDKGRTMADKFASNFDGSTGAETPDSPVYFEKLINLWEAGTGLWQTSPSSRTIYTTTDGKTLLPFTTANDATLKTYLNAPMVNGVDQTDNLILWTRGDDGTAYNNDPDGDGIDDYRYRTVDINGSGVYNVWKLGDILNSTPRIVSWMPLDKYDSPKIYNDLSYHAFITNATGYLSRGTVYAGGNDGMLHAFNLGLLKVINDPTQPNLKAQLTGTNLGVERWAFIPKNVLPYLQYISGISTNQSGVGPGYCHIYGVDLTPYAFDASVGGCGNGSDYWDCAKSADGSTWRTILIGGMRLGGASAPPSANCCSSTNTSNCNNCMTIPDATNNNGYSEYFALDVTDENNPKLLWEFTNPDLGFTTSGPAVVRISAKGDSTGNSKNGRWFVVFGSGPTGPMDTTDHQFMGYSDQHLQYFVLDLASGALLKTIDTGVTNAFSGDLFNVTNDSNMDYQDEALYGGYVRDDGTKTWTQGGGGRILTLDTATGKEAVDGSGNPDPTKWSYQQLIDGIGPVTAGIARLQNNITNKLWLYFGTGRDYYSYYTSSPVVDALCNQNYLVGMTDPCYASSTSLFDLKCITTNTTDDGNSYPLPFSGTSKLASVDLTSTAGATVSSSQYGWYITLGGACPPGQASCGSCPALFTYPEYEGDPAQGNVTNITDTYGAERVLTDPETAINGTVYFTTMKPYDEQCGIGGKSFLWAVYYSNAASLAGTMAGQGTALLQVSTGSIQKINLSTSLTFNGGRSTTAYEGLPPTAAGLALFTSPPPMMQMLHIREEK